MKTHYFLILVILFFSCKKSQNDDAQPTEKSAMSAKISLNNLQFQAKENETYVSTVDSDTWQITGANEANDMLTLYVPINTQVGTYRMEGGVNARYRGLFFKQGNETYTSQANGTITITQKTDKFLKGTFSFNAQGFSQIISGQSISITQGTFLANFF